MDDRYWPVLVGVRAILQRTLKPESEALPAGAETVADGEWVRSLVERARLEVLPYGRIAPELQQLHTQLLSIELSSVSDVARARRLITALLASLPLAPDDDVA